MAQEYWIVIAKNTTMGDVEVWYGDYEDCQCFYEANDGYLNGAFLEIVPDDFLNELLQQPDPEEKEMRAFMEELGYDNNLLDEIREMLFS